MSVKYDEGRGEITLESGRRLWVSFNVLGISPTGEVSYGYDGKLVDYPEFTTAERTEIALEMIGRWTQWAQHGEQYEDDEEGI